MIGDIGGATLDALGILNVVLCDKVNEETFHDLLIKEATGAGMRAAAPGQHVFLERGEMKFGGVTFFPHALPALGVEFGAVRMDVRVVSEKPAREEDRRAGRDVESIFEGPSSTALRYMVSEIRVSTRISPYSGNFSAYCIARCATAGSPS